jgi:hypothetical protein
MSEQMWIYHQIIEPKIIPESEFEAYNLEGWEKTPAVFKKRLKPEPVAVALEVVEQEAIKPEEFVPEEVLPEAVVQEGIVQEGFVPEAVELEDEELEIDEVALMNIPRSKLTLEQEKVRHAADKSRARTRV